MRRRLSRKERERRRRLIQAALIAVVIIIAIAIIFLVKGCADRKKSADKANNSSVVNETTQQGINMTETENNSILNIYLQIWFIGRTLASQAGKAGSIPVICFLQGILRN